MLKIKMKATETEIYKYRYKYELNFRVESVSWAKLPKQSTVKSKPGEARPNESSQAFRTRANLAQLYMPDIGVYITHIQPQNHSSKAER